MGIVVGIDLGTCFSLVAVCSSEKEHVIDLVANRDGEKLTPSVIEIEKPFEVNSRVAEHIGVPLGQTDLDQNKVLYRFKRHMGTDERFAAFGVKYSPVSLSSMILRKLRDDAEDKVGEKIEHAVITVPANFTSEARRQTKEAAQNAGIGVLDLVAEPTAAALYAAFKDSGEVNGNCCVVDLGGGTLDVSVLTIADQQIRVLASEGDNLLGGYDFDDCLRDLIHQRAMKAYGKSLPDGEPTPSELEGLKKALGRLRQRTYRTADMDLVIQRSEFETALGAFLQRIEAICSRSLQESRLAANEIRKVILVGGSVRVPAVRRVIERIFSNAECRVHADCDTAVANGAGLYAAILADRDGLMKFDQRVLERIRGFHLGEISHKYYGILHLVRKGGKHHKVNSNFIDRGETLPVINRSREFRTVKANQTAVRFRITESSEKTSDPSQVQVIQEHKLQLPRGRDAGKQVNVRYDMDYDHILRCVFVDEESGKRSQVEFKTRSSQKQSDDQLRSSFPALDHRSDSDDHPRLKNEIVAEVRKSSVHKADQLAHMDLKDILQDSSIYSAIRMAQSKVLGPLVEDWRIRMIRIYRELWRREIPPPIVVGEGSGVDGYADLEKLEILDLQRLARRKRVYQRIPMIDRERIDWLHTVRNTLAHPSSGVVDWNVLQDSHGIWEPD